MQSAGCTDTPQAHAPKMRTMVTEMRMAPTGLVSLSRKIGSVYAAAREEEDQGRASATAWHGQLRWACLHRGRVHQQQCDQQAVALCHELRRERRCETAEHRRSGRRRRLARTGATACACAFCSAVPLRLSTWRWRVSVIDQSAVPLRAPPAQRGPVRAVPASVRSSSR